MLFNIYICMDISSYEPIEEEKRSFLCELLNRSIGHIFDVTMIIAQAHGLTVALL